MQPQAAGFSKDNRLILTEVFLGTFVFSVILFSYRSGLSWIAQISACLLIAAFIYEVLKIKDFKFIMPVPLFCYLLFAMYISLSLIWTNQSISMMATVFQLFLVSFIMTNIISYQGHFRSITYGLFAALLFATFNLWQQLGGLVNHDETVRISSFLQNPNAFAMALFVGMLLSIERLIRKTDPNRSTIRRYISMFMLLFLVILFAYEIVFLTGSRKAMLSVFIVGFLLFLKLLVEVKFLQKLLMLAAGVGVLTGLFILLKESVYFERLNRVFDMLAGKSVPDGSLNERSDMMANALNLWKDKPIVGWGTDQFRYISGFQTYSHNNFLELLSNNGLLGCVLYYSIILILLFSALTLLLSSNKKHNHVGWFAITTILIFIFWDIAAVTYYSKLHWIMISIIMGISYYAKSPLLKLHKMAKV